MILFSIRKKTKNRKQPNVRPNDKTQYKGWKNVITINITYIHSLNCSLHLLLLFLVFFFYNDMYFWKKKCTKNERHRTHISDTKKGLGHRYMASLTSGRWTHCFLVITGHCLSTQFEIFKFYIIDSLRHFQCNKPSYIKSIFIM